METAMPYLALASPDFSTKSQTVLDARDQHWCAETPFGLAVLRHREAGLLLRDKRLRQGSYAWPDLVGISGSFAEFWKRSIISQEGEGHRQLRAIAIPALSEDYISSLKPEFTSIANDLTCAILDSDRCEFVSDFSHPFSGKAICTLLDVPFEQYEFVAGNASDLGLAMGVDAPKYQSRFNSACDRLMEFSDQLIARVRSGGDKAHYVARLIEQYDVSGLNDLQILRDLIVISIFGGVDTTRAQLGFAIALFIQHPKQWQALRNDPALAPQAVEEIIRHWPTTTWATREAMEDLEFQETKISAGQTLHFLVHSGALDPTITDDPNFDITKRRKIHFGFGGGAHHCLGALVARTDMACALSVLAENVEQFSYAGNPEFMPDSGNTSPIKMPLIVQ